MYVSGDFGRRARLIGSTALVAVGFAMAAPSAASADTPELVVVTGSRLAVSERV